MSEDQKQSCSKCNMGFRPDLKNAITIDKYFYHPKCLPFLVDIDITENDVIELSKFFKRQLDIIDIFCCALAKISTGGNLDVLTKSFEGKPNSINVFKKTHSVEEEEKLLTNVFKLAEKFGFYHFISGSKDMEWAQTARYNYIPTFPKPAKYLWQFIAIIIRGRMEAETEE